MQPAWQPQNRPLLEVESQQFKQINYAEGRNYLYVPHNGHKIPIVPCDVVFNFKSPVHRVKSQQQKVLILRSLPALNCLLRERKVADAVGLKGIYEAFKYLGVCAVERPHWRTTEQAIRVINITYAGCMRMLDIFADLDSLVTDEPGPEDDAFPRFLFLWLRPCGFNKDGQIVLKDFPDDHAHVEDDATDVLFGEPEEEDKHAADPDNDEALYYRDPFAMDQSREAMDPVELERRRAEVEAKRLEEIKRDHHRRVFWQYVPIATKTQDLRSITLDKYDDQGLSLDPELHSEHDHCFVKYPHTIYLGKVSSVVRGIVELARGNNWRHMSFGPPVFEGNNHTEHNAAAIREYLIAMSQARPKARVLQVDATGCQ
jgi:hypothetical protein